jgi:antibiotic biosynthesis monooxygenase (ABM) superfamily enzyme
VRVPDTTFKKKFYATMALYAILLVLATFTLDGNIRLATWIFFGGLIVKTCLRYFAEP